MVGALKCKCKQDEATYGKLTVYSKQYNYTDAAGENKTAPLCQQFEEDMGKELVMNNSIKYLIIIINTVIRMIVIKIIQLVGVDTESSQMKYTTDAVFVCQFFNTGFLLMLCNANLKE